MHPDLIVLPPPTLEYDRHLLHGLRDFTGKNLPGKRFLNFSKASLIPRERSEFEENLTASRGALGETAFTAAFAQGQVMTLVEEDRLGERTSALTFKDPNIQRRISR